MNQEEKYQEIKKLITEYNKAAIEENSSIRLGLAESESNKDYRKNCSDLTHEEFIKENSYYENASVSIEIYGADYGWFPSSICY